jgi:hypothetical protein
MTTWEQHERFLEAQRRWARDSHPFEPSEFTEDRRNPTRPACALCGNSEHATIHIRT